MEGEGEEKEATGLHTVKTRPLFIFAPDDLQS
jgi:hypothetical protein